MATVRRKKEVDRDRKSRYVTARRRLTMKVKEWQRMEVVVVVRKRRTKKHNRNK